jgi:hypothetical protein
MAGSTRAGPAAAAQFGTVRPSRRSATPLEDWWGRTAGYFGLFPASIGDLTRRVRDMAVGARQMTMAA